MWIFAKKKGGNEHIQSNLCRKCVIHIIKMEKLSSAANVERSKLIYQTAAHNRLDDAVAMSE